MSLNSPFGKMLQALIARIAAQVPEIKYIDQDMGQLEGTSTRPSVAFPCALIDFKNFNFDDLSNNAQQGLGDVVIKFASAQFSPSSNNVDDTYREVALQYYEVEWKLNQALHGWSPGEEFGYMSRRIVDSQNVIPGIRSRPLTYKLGFEDYSTRDVDQVVHPDLDFDGQVKSSLP